MTFWRRRKLKRALTGVILARFLYLALFVLLISWHFPVSSSTETSPFAARYIRVHLTSSLALHFQELKAFDARTNTNIALKKSVTASPRLTESFCSNKAVCFLKDYVVDGLVPGNDLETSYYHSGMGGGPYFVEVDFGESYCINRVILYNRNSCCQGRIAGAILSLKSAARAAIWSATLNSDLIQSFIIPDSLVQQCVFTPSPLLTVSESISPPDTSTSTATKTRNSTMTVEPLRTSTPSSSRVLSQSLTAKSLLTSSRTKKSATQSFSSQTKSRSFLKATVPRILLAVEGAVSERSIVNGPPAGSAPLRIKLSLPQSVVTWKCNYLLSRPPYSFFRITVDSYDVSNRGVSGADRNGTQGSESTTSGRTGLGRYLPELLEKTNDVFCGLDVVSFPLSRVPGFQIDAAEEMELHLDFSEVFVAPPGYYVDTDAVAEHQAAFAQRYRISIEADLPRPEVQLPKSVQKSAEATSEASSVAMAMAGNPALAVQGARTAMILQLATCRAELDDELSVGTHPTGIAFGDGPLKAYGGACLWNTVIVLGASLAHAMVGCAVGMSGSTVSAGLQTVRFPALQAIVIMPLLQPTFSCATTVLQHATQADVGQLVMASIVYVMSIAFLFGLTRMTVWKFRAVLQPFPPEDNVGSLHRFFFGDGEWEDASPSTPSDTPQSVSSICNFAAVLGESGNETGEAKPRNKSKPKSKSKGKGRKDSNFVRSTFMFFDLYKGKRQWYAVLETLWTVVFGFIEGWIPQSRMQCDIIAVSTTVLFCLMLVLVLVLRPYMSLFNMIFAVVLVVIQFGAALLTTVFVIGGVEIAAKLAGWAAAAAMYALALKAVTDLATLVYTGIHRLMMSRRRKALRKQARRSEDSDETGSEDEAMESLMEPMTLGGESLTASPAQKQSPASLLSPGSRAQGGRSVNPLLVVPQGSKRKPSLEL